MGETNGVLSGQPAEFLEEELKWYNWHAGFNRFIYYSLRIVTLVGGALIAPLTQLHDFAGAVTALGIIITVVEGSQQLFKFHDNWTRYRTACEALRHEKILLAGNAAPYNGTDKQAQLAQRITMIMSVENGKWQNAEILPPKQP